MRIQLIGTAILFLLTAQVPPAIDSLIDVGGYKLHMTCTGAGTPTVVLEAGLGDNSRVWQKVSPEVSKFTRVCSYDRANLGRSEPAPRSLRNVDGTSYLELRSGQQLLHDFETLLERAGVSGPYVLVGHSFGGLSAMFYAARHPTEVVGIGLVDSVHPDQVARLEALMPQREATIDHDELIQNREGFDIDRILSDVRGMQWHTDAPLVVIAEGRVDANATDAEKREAVVWRELQTDLSRRSSRATLVIAEQSGHNIQNDQPDVIVNAIRQLSKKMKD